MQALKAEGYLVLGSALGATASAVGDVDWSRRTAIVLGNEAEGLSDEMLACCDATFHIPMAGACTTNRNTERLLVFVVAWRVV